MQQVRERDLGFLRPFWGGRGFRSSDLSGRGGLDGLTLSSLSRSGRLLCLLLHLASLWACRCLSLRLRVLGSNLRLLGPRCCLGRSRSQLFRGLRRAPHGLHSHPGRRQALLSGPEVIYDCEVALLQAPLRAAHGVAHLCCAGCMPDQRLDELPKRLLFQGWALVDIKVAQVRTRREERGDRSAQAPGFRRRIKALPTHREVVGYGLKAALAPVTHGAREHREAAAAGKSQAPQVHGLAKAAHTPQPRATPRCKLLQGEADLPERVGDLPKTTAERKIQPQEVAQLPRHACDTLQGGQKGKVQGQRCGYGGTRVTQEGATLELQLLEAAEHDQGRRPLVGGAGAADAGVGAGAGAGEAEATEGVFGRSLR
mmetsp:Transcript_96605/g.207246  ORF Transcript_96605/g.207246 Transcript_96605/m.207246 type:complete len:370 (+) Transcript_96605:1341-2450(+)